MANVGIYDMTDTWNNAGTSFTAIKMNVTDTASASGSKLLDIQKGGSSLLVVDKSGNMDIGGTLDVTGATTLDSTLTVSGDVSIADKIIHTGDTNTAIRFPSNDAVTVETAGTERLRVTSAGRMLVGRTSDLAGERLSVTGYSVFGSTRQVLIGADGTTAFVGTLTNHDQTFRTNNTERMRVTSDGYLRMASGSGGIQFNGDTAAANALDDYEEGTFTPVVADASSGGNTASTSSAGHYTKIGRCVSAQIRATNINTTGMTAGNVLFFRGLPFVSGASMGISIGAVAVDGVNFTGYLVADISPGNAFASFRDIVDSGSDSDLLVSDIVASGSSDIIFQITYFV